VVGEALAQKYAQLGVPTEVFANFLHNAAELPPPKVTRARPPFRILYVGGIGGRKGTTVLLDAVRLLLQGGLDVQLVLAGAGPSEAFLNDIIATPPLKGRVSFLGWVPRGSILDELYREADLFVMPSLSEGIPKVIIEAMTHGVPVVGSQVGGIPALLDFGGRGWLAPPGDARELAQVVRAALLDPDGRQRRSSRARDFIERNDRSAIQRMITTALTNSAPELLRGPTGRKASPYGESD
jgi:glycosyltransferase involved in cell wall biosynthesis